MKRARLLAPRSRARSGWASCSHRPGCAVALADLRLLHVRPWGFDGGTPVGELVVHADAAQAVAEVFRASGWGWGGESSSSKDDQHLSADGR